MRRLACSLGKTRRELKVTALDMRRFAMETAIDRAVVGTHHELERSDGRAEAAIDHGMVGTHQGLAMCNGWGRMILPCSLDELGRYLAQKASIRRSELPEITTTQ